MLQICSHAVDKLCSHCLFPKTHKLLHVCKQVVTCLQTSCYKSVHKLSTSCVRTACSPKHTSCYMSANKLLYTNLFTSCRQVVFALLVPQKTQVVTCLQTSCYMSANKLLQICSQAVDKLCSHYLFPVVVTSLEQAELQQLVTSLMALIRLVTRLF
jgi:hypothetical protein